MSILERAHYARGKGSNYYKFNVKNEKFNVFFLSNYHKFNANFKFERFMHAWLRTP